MRRPMPWFMYPEYEKYFEEDHPWTPKADAPEHLKEAVAAWEKEGTEEVERETALYEKKHPRPQA